MSGLHGISDAIPLIIVKEYRPQQRTSPGFSSQRRAADGSAEPYAYSYLFAYALDVVPGARTLTLPDNDRIRILAINSRRRAVGHNSSTSTLRTERALARINHESLPRSGDLNLALPFKAGYTRK